MDVLRAPAPASSAADAHPRQPYFTPDSESYGTYEGASVRNGCTQDRDCLITGCFRSTCAAVVTEVSDNDFCKRRSGAQWPQPQFGQCGCLKGECLWYFESDYDRPCEEESDCAGLGPPPEGKPAGKHGKGIWGCVQGACQFL